MGTFPNFTLINLTTSISLAKSCYKGQFNVENLTTVFRKADSEKYYPAFYIHTLGDDLYITTRGSANQYDFDTLLDSREVKTKYGTFHGGYFKAAMNTFTRSFSYIRKPYKKVYFIGHSYGGSVSQIMAVITKSEFPDKEVIAVGFGPVPCMDSETSEKFKDSIITIVNKEDFIPTFSVSNVKHWIHNNHPHSLDINIYQVNEDINNLFDNYNITNVPTGDVLKENIHKQMKEYAIKALHEKRKRKYTAKYPAGYVYKIGQEGKNTIYQSLIEPEKDLNVISTDPYAIFYHTPNPYNQTLFSMQLY